MNVRWILFFVISDGCVEPEHRLVHLVRTIIHIPFEEVDKDLARIGILEQHVVFWIALRLNVWLELIQQQATQLNLIF